jgi:hypothetical protein
MIFPSIPDRRTPAQIVADADELFAACATTDEPQRTEAGDIGDAVADRLGAPQHAPRDAQDQAVDALLARGGRAPQRPATDAQDAVVAAMLTRRYGITITAADVASGKADDLIAARSK